MYVYKSELIKQFYSFTVEYYKKNANFTREYENFFNMLILIIQIKLFFFLLKNN